VLPHSFRAGNTREDQDLGWPSGGGPPLCLLIVLPRLARERISFFHIFITLGRTGRARLAASLAT
jgi:hypothetical protein